MSNAQVKEIEKDMKNLFYDGQELPLPNSVSVPIGDGIETGEPRPLPDDRT